EREAHQDRAARHGDGGADAVEQAADGAVRQRRDTTGQAPWSDLAISCSAALTKAAPSSPALPRASIHCARIGSVAFFQAARSAPSIRGIGVLRFMTAPRPTWSHPLP